MRALLVAGARPNFMKIAPILSALELDGVETSLVHSGQHYDAAMSDVFFRDLGMRAPDSHLGAGSGSHAAQTARVMTSFEPVLDEFGADVVVVVGDVNSTIACSLVAAKKGIRVAHVEAGLRSRDWSMPEEVNRVVTDRLSDVLLAPSDDAAANLRSEGYHDDQIHVVGNVMVDSLMQNLDRARAGSTLADLGVAPREYGLVTLHRPSNVDDPEVFERLMSAVGTVAQRLPLIFPVRKRVEQYGAVDGLQLIEPAGYLDFIALQDGARLVLTDSGGIQEETTMLGVPCLTLRTTTERPITIEQGSNTLVGTGREAIERAAAEVLDQPLREFLRPPLWDGKAATRISEVLRSLDESSPRPTDLR
jgi:UDP-N-acetylglucosamine 2-epimerase (non-hydrolysing)